MEIINTRRIYLDNGEVIPLEQQLVGGKFKPTKEFFHYKKNEDMWKERTLKDEWDQPLEYKEDEDTYTYSLDSCKDMEVTKENNKTSQMLALDNIKGLPIKVNPLMVRMNPGLSKYMQPK